MQNLDANKSIYIIYDSMMFSGWNFGAYSSVVVQIFDQLSPYPHHTDLSANDSTTLSHAVFLYSPLSDLDVTELITASQKP